MESLALCTALIHPKVPTLYRAPPVVRKDNDSVAIAVSSMGATDYSQLNTSLFRTNGENTGFQTNGGDGKLFETSVVDFDYNRICLNHGGSSVEQVGRKTDQGGQGNGEVEVKSVTMEDDDGAGGGEEVDATADEKSGGRVVDVTRKLVGGENTPSSYIDRDQERQRTVTPVEETVSKVS